MGLRERDRKRDTEKKWSETVLSFSVGEAWLSNNLIVALVCSPHRQPLPVGLISADLWGRETTQTTAQPVV